MMEEKNFFGNQIKLIRRRNGLNQLELSKIIGISRPQLTNIECGISNGSLITLLKICHGLSCTPNDLLGFDSVPAEEQELKLKEALKQKIIEKLIESAEKLSW